MDNLPIGLFGEFYYHELSFNLINKNDYKNLENIFKQCNLNIKKLLLESFVKGSLVSNTNPKIDTFFYIQIENNNSKIFYFENNVIKFEQKFKFGTEIVEKDISKITSLSSEIVKKIIELNPDINNATDDEIIESNFFINDRFRKIKKRLIYEIAKARIKEFSEIFYFNNVNFRKILNKIDIVFLEINSQKHLSCFENIYLSCFASKEKFRVETAKKPSIERLIESAYKITKFGWSKEAIPTTREKSSYIARFFQALFK